MKAFGAKIDAAAPQARRRPVGNATESRRPPPSAAPALRNWRRSNPTPGGSSRILNLPITYLPRDVSAATDISRHRGVNIGVGGPRCGRQQCHSRHDLARLAVPALNDIEIKPRLLDRFAQGRGADRLDSCNSARADTFDRSDTGTARCTVDMHGACSAQGNPATKLRARHAEHVAQYPQKRRVAVDFDGVRHPVNPDREGHRCLSSDLRGTCRRNPGAFFAERLGGECVAIHLFV